MTLCVVAFFAVPSAASLIFDVLSFTVWLGFVSSNEIRISVTESGSLEWASDGFTSKSGSPSETFSNPFFFVLISDCGSRFGCGLSDTDDRVRGRAIENCVDNSLWYSI